MTIEQNDKIQVGKTAFYNQMHFSRRYVFKDFSLSYFVKHMFLTAIQLQKQ